MNLFNFCFYLAFVSICVCQVSDYDKEVQVVMTGNDFLLESTDLNHIKYLWGNLETKWHPAGSKN